MLKQRLFIRFLSLLGLTIATLSAASEFSLGRVNGPVVLGERLDVAVSVSVAAQDNLTPACFSVEVLDGDIPVAERFLNLTVTPGPQPRMGVLRVRSATPLNEPVVNLTVRVGCSANLVRRYILLPDLPGAESDSSASIALPLVQAGAQTPTITALAAPQFVAPQAPEPAQSTQVGTPDPSVTPAGPSAPAPSPQNPDTGVQAPAASGPRALAPAKAPAKAKARPAAPPTTVGARPRLQLALVDLAGTRRPEPDLSKSVTTSTGAVSAGTSTVSGTAAVEPPAYDVLADEKRLRMLETGIQSLLTISKANHASIQQLEARLAEAESQRFNNPLVYLLGFSLLLALGLAAALWQRQRQAERQGAEPWDLAHE